MRKKFLIVVAFVALPCVAWADSTEDAQNFYRGCVAHHAERFSSSKDDVFVIAKAVTGNCIAERTAYEDAVFDHLFTNRPNNSKPPGFYRQAAVRVADTLQDAARDWVISYIAEERLANQ